MWSLEPLWPHVKQLGLWALEWNRGEEEGCKLVPISLLMIFTVFVTHIRCKMIQTFRNKDPK